MRDAEACVVGGGPAGLVLGLLFARQGRNVMVLETHADFLRDFRGDTVHPSTLDVMDEIRLGGRLEELPHRKMRGLRITFPDGRYQFVDFSRLRVAHPYVMFLPQWDFLELLAHEAAPYPGSRCFARPRSSMCCERMVASVAPGPPAPTAKRRSARG